MSLLLETNQKLEGALSANKYNFKTVLQTVRLELQRKNEHIERIKKEKHNMLMRRAANKGTVTVQTSVAVGADEATKPKVKRKKKFTNTPPLDTLGIYLPPIQLTAIKQEPPEISNSNRIPDIVNIKIEDCSQSNDERQAQGGRIQSRDYRSQRDERPRESYKDHRREDCNDHRRGHGSRDHRPRDGHRSERSRSRDRSHHSSSRSDHRNRNDHNKRHYSPNRSSRDHHPSKRSRRSRDREDNGKDHSRRGN